MVHTILTFILLALAYLIMGQLTVEMCNYLMKGQITFWSGVVTRLLWPIFITAALIGISVRIAISKKL